jgi:hypothetical protein
MSGEVRWYKSSCSSDQGGQCVEVARWRKSSRSSDQGGDCVEVARLTVERSPIGVLLPLDSVRDH